MNCWFHMAKSPYLLGVGGKEGIIRAQPGQGLCHPSMPSIPTPTRDSMLHLDGNAGVVLLQVFQADLQVQLTSPSNDVLPRLLNDALKEAIC